MAIILAIISATSLIISYNFIESTAWNASFNPKNLGVIIEFSRTCILLMLMIIIVGNIFNKEAEIYIYSGTFTDRHRLTFMIGAIILIIIVIQHFYIGPNALCTKYSISNDKYFRECLLPYMMYMPCSLINYLAVGIPLGSLYIHVVIEDCKEFINKRLNYDNFINNFKVISIEQCSHELEKQLIILYHQFCNQTKRHINIIGAMIFIVSFDVLFANGTLSKSGYVWVQFFYIFWFLAPIIITVYFAWSEYGNVFATTLNFLLERGIDNTKIRTKYNNYHFLNEVIISNTLLRIVLVILPILYYFFYFKK